MLNDIQPESLRQAIAKDTGIFFSWSYNDPALPLYPKGSHSFIIGCHVCNIWVRETATIPLRRGLDLIEKQSIGLLGISCKTHNCPHLARFKATVENGPSKRQKRMAANIENEEDNGTSKRKSRTARRKGSNTERKSTNARSSLRRSNKRNNDTRTLTNDAAGQRPTKSIKKAGRK